MKTEYLTIGTSYLPHHFAKAEETFDKAFHDAPSGDAACAIAEIYKKTASNNKDHLRLCIKWYMRGVKLHHITCVEKLIDLFENSSTAQAFRNILNGHQNRSITLLPHNVDIECISVTNIANLARKCYEEKNLDILSDSYLNTGEYKQPSFAEIVRSSIRLML